MASWVGSQRVWPCPSQVKKTRRALFDTYTEAQRIDDASASRTTAPTETPKPAPNPALAPAERNVVQGFSPQRRRVRLKPRTTFRCRPFLRARLVGRLAPFFLRADRPS